MIHKCYGCLWVGEYRDMGATTPICTRERFPSLTEAIKAYEAESCPYKLTRASALQAATETAVMPMQETAEETQSEIAKDDLETFLEAVKRIGEVVGALASVFTDKVIHALKKVAENIVPAIAQVSKAVLDLYPNKRVVHLARHGKKARTRKKNQHRIMRWFEKIGKQEKKETDEDGEL